MNTHGACTKTLEFARKATKAGNAIRGNVRGLYDSTGLTEDDATTKRLESLLDSLRTAVGELQRISAETFALARRHRGRHKVQKSARLIRISGHGTSIENV